MPENFNQLTPAQTERLAILSEECGEVVQIVGKILRHGYQSHNPDTFTDATATRTNRQLLEDELGHIMYSQNKLGDAGDLDLFNVTTSASIKAERIEQYLHHN